MANIPSASSKVQLEETSFRSSISTDLVTRVGATINQGIDNASPVPLGSVEMSMLSEAQFHGVRNDGWVLCDGRNIVGSSLNLLTGQTIAADSRGRFIRAKDNGRGLDPNGDLPIGTALTNSAYGFHTHATPTGFTGTDAGASGPNPDTDTGSGATGVFPTDPGLAIQVTLAVTGASENRPDNVTVNFFIRIN